MADGSVAMREAAPASPAAAAASARASRPRGSGEPADGTRRAGIGHLRAVLGVAAEMMAFRARGVKMLGEAFVGVQPANPRLDILTVNS